MDTPGGAAPDGSPSGPLRGLSVVDASVGPAAAVATMVLADYGAAVTRLEPPGGVARHRQPAYQAWDRGKQLAIVDPTRRDAPERFAALVGAADVYVDDDPSWRLALGFDADTVRRRFPELIHLVISADGDPDRPGPLDDTLTVARLGGLGPPTAPTHPGWLIPTYATASLALLGTLAALVGRRRAGGGQRVGVSMQDGPLALWSFDKLWLARQADAPEPPAAQRFRGKRLLLEMYECADGRYLQFHTGAPGRFWRTMQLLGLDDRISPSQGLLEMAEALDDVEIGVVERDIPAIMRTRSRDEWLSLFWAADICCQPVLSPEEAFGDPQILHNGVIVDVDDPHLGPLRQIGPTVRMSRTPAVIRSGRPDRSVAQRDPDGVGAPARPRPAADRRSPAADSTAVPTARSPLEGIRVLDFGQYIAGPLAMRFLADFGADVIKVEPLVGDTMRPLVANWEYGNRGKRSVSLDLKLPEAQAVVRRLAADADVVGHNLRPGVAERLGIDHATLGRDNPALIYLASPGFGSSGPKVDQQSFAPVTGGTNGLYFDAGGEGNPPRRAGNEDYFNGALGAAAVMMALWQREGGGAGQYLESPQINAALFLMSHTTLDPAGRFTSRLRLDSSQRRYGALDAIYRTADGSVAITAVDHDHFVGLSAALQRPELAVEKRFAGAETRDRHDTELAQVIADALAPLSTGSAVGALRAEGVPCEAVAGTPFETGLLTSERELAQGRVVEFEHVELGRIREVAELVHLSETPCRFHAPGPVLGEHTLEVLGALGYPADEVDALRARHVLGCATVAPG